MTFQLSISSEIQAEMLEVEQELMIYEGSGCDKSIKINVL